MNTHKWLCWTPLGVLFLTSSVVAQAVAADAGTYTTYLGNRHQFTVELPEGWHAIDQSPYADMGVIAFYSKPINVKLDKDPVVRQQQEQAFYKLLDDVNSGALPSFFVDRYKAGKGMSCEQFDARAQKTKVKTFSKAHALGKKPKLIGQPEVTPVDFGGCNGLKVSLSVTNTSGKTMQMLVYTAAVDGMTYDFALLTEAVYFEQNLPWFSRMIESVKLTGAGRS